LRKVFKEDFEIFKIGLNKNRIDWVNSVGKNIRFIYDNIEGKIKIEKLITSTKILISYKNKHTSMHISQFRKCQLGCFLNIYSKKYLYNIGDKVKNKIILEQIRVKQGKYTGKGYKYKCLKDNYIGATLETTIKNLICPVCSNAIVVKGINDMNTTNPKIIPYLVDINDGYKYTYSSGKIIKFQCVDCGFIKSMCINTFYDNGIMCNRCSDNRSYSEKIVFNLLEQIKVDFTSEKVFKWTKKRYDFYISETNTIIEIMGIQHYGKGFELCGGRTLKQEQDNDNYKQEIALKNNITNYIVIDARVSTLEYIKQSIYNCKLSKIYNLDNIDWIKCEKNALTNKVKKACDLWNSGLKSTTKIAKQMKVGSGTIIRYLNKGVKLNWCDYNKEWFYEETIKRTIKMRSKKVEIFKDDTSLGKFCSIAELVNYFNIQKIKLSPSKISVVCNNIRKQHKGYIFKFI